MMLTIAVVLLSVLLLVSVVVNLIFYFALAKIRRLFSYADLALAAANRMIYITGNYLHELENRLPEIAANIEPPLVAFRDVLAELLKRLTIVKEVFMEIVETHEQGRGERQTKEDVGET